MLLKRKYKHFIVEPNNPDILVPIRSQQLKIVLSEEPTRSTNLSKNHLLVAVIAWMNNIRDTES